MGQELKLAEFKALYKAWKRNVVWFDHLLLSFLVWIETKLIDNRVKMEVDEAIKTWETLHSTDSVSSIIVKSPPNTSTKLPKLRITAPWYDDTYNEK